MPRTKNLDLTQGIIWKQLLLFLLPIAAGTLFQQFYSTVDAIVVGRFLGSDALAAVGGSAAVIVQLVVGIFTGLSSGATVVISHGYGADDQEKLTRAVHTSIAFSLLGGIFITIVGILLTPQSLVWLKNPQEIMADATLYLRWYFVGTIPMLLFNMGSGILRAVGDSKRPLSNLVSALLILTQLAKAKEGYRFRPKQTKIHRPTLTHILGIGVPAAVESSMYAFSNLLIQVPINNLGTDAVAAWSATSKVDGIYWSLIVSFGVAIMAFVGQNYGAGKYDRMKASVKVCMQIAMGTTIVLSVLLMIFAKYCFLLFTDNPQVIQYATQVVYYFAPFYFIWTVIEVLANALRGAGDALAPMVISVGGVCGLRILWVFLVVPHWPTLLGISICYPLSWVLTALLLILRYRRAKWHEKAKGTVLPKEA